MANVRGRKARRRAKINNTRYGHKRKKLNKTPIPHMEELRSRWDKRKTAKQNLQALGIAYDVNTALPIAKPEGKSGDEEDMMTIEEAKKLVQSTGTGAPPVRPDPLVAKWIDEIQKTAESREKGTSLPVHHFSQREKKFLKEIIQCHGSNYVAMSRDKKNLYQWTPCQLKRKCEAFLLTLAAHVESDQEDGV